MKEIKLSQNQVALVDDKDFEFLSQFKWFVKKSRSHFYAVRHCSILNRKIRMHRELMCVSSNLILVDHINGNSLDNRKENLRVATNQQNLFNRGKQKNNTSDYKGVIFDKRCKQQQWIARIMLNQKQIHLGYFEHPQLAALAYNIAAVKYFGEFARLNEIDVTSLSD